MYKINNLLVSIVEGIVNLMFSYNFVYNYIHVINNISKNVIFQFASLLLNSHA